MGIAVEVALLDGGLGFVESMLCNGRQAHASVLQLLQPTTPEAMGCQLPADAKLLLPHLQHLIDA